MDKLAKEAITLLERLKADYRLIWDESYNRLGSGTPQLGRGHSYLMDGSPSNSLFSHVANEESRRDEMHKAARTLEQTVSDLRSAFGRVDTGHKPASSNWDKQSLRETEARYQDNKRLPGRKWASGTQSNRAS